jgi:hypothetical protein
MNGGFCRLVQAFAASMAEKDSASHGLKRK